LFKPKIYKSNGPDAYHLINEEGGSFLYEGKVEYSEAELFKDEQGRAYYLVTTDIGPSKYYVEVEPEAKPIHISHEKKEKTISDLIMSSPREAPQKAAVPEPAPVEIKPAEEQPPVKQPDTCFESPEVIKPEPIAPTTHDEAEAAVKAMAALGEHRPRKKRKIFSLPVIVALILSLAVIAAAGVYLIKPDLITRLNLPFIPTPTPEPTSTPTPTPVPTATPGPTAGLPGGPDLYKSLLAIAPAIEGNNTTVIDFANNHTNVAGGSYHNLAKASDLFDYVNAHWVPIKGVEVPQPASYSVSTLKGDDRDYSILMASLMRSLGIDARVIAAYDGTAIHYYPEIKIAQNETAYTDAKNYLRGRYNITDPYVHINGNGYWLAMSPGSKPGIKIAATDEFFTDYKGNIEKI
jgi:transglutaminase-like putative cysteine protease